MRSIIVLMLCSVVVTAFPSLSSQRHYDLNKAPEYFAQFVKDNKRRYKNNADRDVHYAAFVENLKKINQLNDESPSATFAINKHADYTAEESQWLHGFKVPTSWFRSPDKDPYWT